jgi:hypothetical protein
MNHDEEGAAGGCGESRDVKRGLGTSQFFGSLSEIRAKISTLGQGREWGRLFGLRRGISSLILQILNVYKRISASGPGTCPVTPPETICSPQTPFYAWNADIISRKVHL